jgi:hypothetical protein
VTRINQSWLSWLVMHVPQQCPHTCTNEDALDRTCVMRRTLSRAVPKVGDSMSKESERSC